MRISQLDLLRYGKFADQVVPFPRATSDFHFVIGPNEAGKSTVRNAILDLLFGIEPRSPYGFLYPYSEMALGASLEDTDKQLDFRRVKKKQSLITPTGETLSDDTLEQFIGKTDRAFFDQMFGLDHRKLVSGGEEILDSSNDIGQLLFQSAAGVASLGEIRDAFEKEADTIWAKTKSSKRSYYAAADELAAAESVLKAASVRTKEWSAAQALVEDLQGKLSETKVAMSELETRRAKLERIRRVGPSIRVFQTKSKELSELGDVSALPVDAAQALQKAEIELAKAEQEKVVFQDQLEATRVSLTEIEVDTEALERKDQIDALFQRRQQVRNHEGDIVKRQNEVQFHWEACLANARQLGWEATDESELEKKLPTVPVRTAMTGLVKQVALLDQTLSSARDALREKVLESASVEEQLKLVPDTVVPASLKNALNAARALGDVETSRGNKIQAVAKAKRELQASIAELGNWFLDIENLRRLELPAPQEVDGLLLQLTNHEKTRDAQEVAHTDLEDAIQGQELDIAQYRAKHHTISHDDLLAARAKRDTLWASIRADASGVESNADRYENLVLQADESADRRADSAQETGELQGKLDNIARLKLNLANIQARIEAATAKHTDVHQVWTERIRAAGLDGMPIHTIDSWRQTRDRTLRAEEALRDADEGLLNYQVLLDTAAARLTEALTTSGCATVPGSSLADLIEVAAGRVDSATHSQIQRDTLQKQLEMLTTSAKLLEERVTAAERNKTAWNNEWQKCLAQAGLAADTQVGAVEGTLVLFDKIDEELSTIASIRSKRIETMKSDLQEFARESAGLGAAIAGKPVDETGYSLAEGLMLRLQRATSANVERERVQQELRRQEKQVEAANLRIRTESSKLTPLMDLAGVNTTLDLHHAITRSDAWRELTNEVAEAKRAVLAAGDGLALETLEGELDTTNLDQLGPELTEISVKREDLNQNQNDLSAELATATSELRKIAGQDQAAIAESSRQDAISKMADSAERFIKVHTAARLLRWSIDRYREDKQGPMLERASEIFNVLTLGSFKRLLVDFEASPPVLEGQRADGRRVPIAGMSDGTRDQLYLALRLAALELHVDQAKPLPFIADDLFINFDDRRATAGLRALAKLSEKTQVIFLSHHDHLLPMAKEVFGESVNVVALT